MAVHSAMSFKALVVGVLLAAMKVSASGADELDTSPRMAKMEEMIRKLEEHVRQQDEVIQAFQNQGRQLSSDSRRLDALSDSITALTASLSSATGDTGGALDHIWLLICGALVMFMQAGFAMVEAGCCRSKNVQNILLKNLTDVAIGTLGWWAFGWMLAYGNPDEDGDGKLDGDFAGSIQAFGSGFMEDKDGVVTPLGTRQLNWFFQWAFCSAAATIVSGGVAERAKFPGYCFFSFFMTAFIYPIVVAWTWGYGWLEHMNDVGYMDFAGSGIVHMTGGVGALVGAIAAGPRDGRWENPDEFVPHSLPLVVLGTFILWFGWYGFNCGSTLGLSTTAQGEQAAQVAMNTTIAAATGGLTVFCMRAVLLKGLYDIGGFCNGILAGLVSITAPCGTVHSHDAFIIGLLGGAIYQGSSIAMKKLGIDDPIDAFAVHGAAGAWGVLAAALFDWGKGGTAHGWSGFSCKTKDDGSCIEDGWSQLIAANLVEIIVIAAWVGGLSAIVFIPLRLAGLLRAEEELQERGMDSEKHSPSKAYSIEEKTINTAKRVTHVAHQVVPAKESDAP